MLHHIAHDYIAARVRRPQNVHRKFQFLVHVLIMCNQKGQNGNMKPITNVGEFIRQSRAKRGMSLREAAIVLQASPSYLSKVERGVETPGAALISRLSLLLHWTSGEIDAAMLSAGHLPFGVMEMLQKRPELISILRENYACAEVFGAFLPAGDPRGQWSSKQGE